MRFALLLAALAGTANPPQQFNLDCSPIAPTDLRKVSFRIDLASSQFCQDACASVAHIVEVTAGRITLSDRRFFMSSLGDSSETKYLDRVTGTYHDLMRPGGNTFDNTWQCTPTSFTGFPGTKF